MNPIPKEIQELSSLVFSDHCKTLEVQHSVTFIRDSCVELINYSVTLFDCTIMFKTRAAELLLSVGLTCTS